MTRISQVDRALANEQGDPRCRTRSRASCQPLLGEWSWSAVLGKTDLHHEFAYPYRPRNTGDTNPLDTEIGYATIIQELSLRDLLSGIIVSSHF